MPAIQRSEFALALNQVSNERGLDPSIVLDTVKNAILAAYRKDHPGTEIEEYTATLDANTGEARIFLNEKDVTPPGFGRIAAQTAKQVILQKIRELEFFGIIQVFIFIFIYSDTQYIAIGIFFQTLIKNLNNCRF